MLPSMSPTDGPSTHSDPQAQIPADILALATGPELQRFAPLHPRFDAEHRLLWLDLDHGKANEMGSAQLAAFEALASWLESDDRVRCVCTSSRRLSKRGKPIFIAGANVTERAEWSPEQVAAHVRRQRELMVRLRHLPLFTIALTHGATLGWGAEYLLAVDYTIATPSATIALPETGLGIIPGARGTADLAKRVGPAQALRLGCVGESLPASQALAIGLVQELAEDLDVGQRRVEAMAKSLMRRSPTAIAAFKGALLAGLGEQNHRRLELEAKAYEHCVQSGQAKIGREHFAQILKGQAPDWGPRVALDHTKS